MSTYTVRFDITLPDDVTQDEAHEFVMFCIGASHECPRSNPLVFEDITSYCIKNVDVSES